MSSRIFISLFQYFNAWLLIAFVVALAAVSEKIYFRGLAAFRPKAAEGGRPSVNFARWFRSPVALPGGARVRTALFCPVLAFAALLTVADRLRLPAGMHLHSHHRQRCGRRAARAVHAAFRGFRARLALRGWDGGGARNCARRDAEHDSLLDTVHGGLRLDSGLSDKERPRHRPVQLQFVFALRADAI